MDFLRLLESLRCDFLDKLFGIITKLGGETFMLIVCIIILWCVNKKHGYYMVSTCFIGLIINQTLKMICRVPRPWIKDPNFTIVESARAEATGYSFPSGHTQNITASLGTTARFTRKLPLRIASISLLLLVAFSRMYLGVHTFADVIVSLLIGSVLIFALYPIFDKSDEKPYPAYIAMGIMCLMAIAFTFFVSLHNWPEDIEIHNLQAAIKAGYLTSGSSLATLLAFHLDRKYVKTETKAVWWLQIIKIVVGLVIVLGIKEGLKPLCTLLFGEHMISSSIRYFFVVFFAALVWPGIITYISKKISVKNKGEK